MGGSGKAVAASNSKGKLKHPKQKLLKAARSAPRTDTRAAAPDKAAPSDGATRKARAGRAAPTHVPAPTPDTPVAARPHGKKKHAAASPIPAEDVKLVRDSFTMPGEDFELIAVLKARALEFKRPTKKSELLRAGLQQLAALSEAQLRAALAALRPLPTGRPKKKR